MVIFINVITVIARSTSKGENSEAQFSEVDDFFPLIIYYLIRIHPPMLKSSLRFIKLFRNPERLVSAEGYYHSLMLSTVDFIEKVGPKTISMKDKEFRDTYFQCERKSVKELEEQASIWQYQPEETQHQKNYQLHFVVKKVIQLLDKTPCKFENITFEQLKEIVDAQGIMIEKFKSISI
jgi:hypothetical protein